MGVAGAKCCAAAEAPSTEAFGEVPAKAVVDSAPKEKPGPPPMPLWLKDAHEHTARVAAQAAKAAEERRKAEEFEAAAKEAQDSVVSPRGRRGAMSPTSSAAEGALSPRSLISPMQSARSGYTATSKGGVLSPRKDDVAPPKAKAGEDKPAPADDAKAAEEEKKKKSSRPAPKAKSGAAPESAAKPSEKIAEDAAAAEAAAKVRAAVAKSGRSSGGGKDPNPKDMVYTLKVKIIGAQNLRNADDFGQSDPFCVCMIKGKPKSKFQTKVVNENANPTWDECVQLSGFGLGDKLVFEVWDKDTFSANDLLGRAELTRSQFTPIAFRGDVKLTDTNAKTAVSKSSKLQLEVEVLQVEAGDSRSALTEVRRYDSGVLEKLANQRKVMVTFVSARGLRNADWGTVNGLSDPYCVCEIPGKECSRIKTPVIKDSLDPVWNFRSQLMDYEDGDSLSFAVLDKDLGKKDDVLGRAALTKDQLARGFRGELSLLDAGKGVKAYLKVVVEVDGQASPAPAVAMAAIAENKVGVARRGEVAMAAIAENKADKPSGGAVTPTGSKKKS